MCTTQLGSRLLGYDLYHCVLLTSVMVCSTDMWKLAQNFIYKMKDLSWAPFSVQLPTLPMAQALPVLRSLAVELRLEEKEEDTKYKNSMSWEAFFQPCKRKAFPGAVIVQSHLQKVWDRRHKRQKITVGNLVYYDNLQVWLFLVAPLAPNYLSESSKNCLIILLTWFIVLTRKDRVEGAWSS